MRIQLLALDGVFDTGLSGLLDVFSTANELADMQRLDSVRFDVTVVGMRRRVRSAQGLSIPVQRLEPLADWVLVPALGTKMPDTLLPALERSDVRDATAALREFADRGLNLGAACIGTFVLAESGQLNGHRATTTWWLSSLFRQRYPTVNLDESQMLVRSGTRLTAGAALSHLDLALWLVRQESPALASLVAKYLILDARPSQSAYIVSDHLSHSDPLVARFETWVRERLHQGFVLDEAAEALATSPRTLARRLQSVLGKSPVTYVQDLRVERAVHLLKTTDLDIEQIAARVGYADGVTLRTLIRRRLGHGIRDIRRAR